MDEKLTYNQNPTCDEKNGSSLGCHRWGNVYISHPPFKKSAYLSGCVPSLSLIKETVSDEHVCH
jgi:hypothetical protein